MDRRAFVGHLALGILAVPLVGEAQQVGKLARIGVLASSTETNFEPSIKVFREALQGDSLSLAEATRRVLGVTEPVLPGMVQWKGTKRNPAQPVSAEADDRRSKSLIWWWPRRGA